MKSTSLLLAFLCLCPPVFAGTVSEIDTIRDTTQDVLELLNRNRHRLQQEPIYIQEVVRELILPHFDFRMMSRLVMGDYWLTFNKTEQDCFVTGFRNLLVERYAYILLSYDNHNITYDKARDIGDLGLRLVRQTISREGAVPLPIEYAMEQRGEEWKVVDLIIDGISLVRSHRGMFQSRIHTQGRDYFIQTFPECQSNQPLAKRRTLPSSGTGHA